MSLVFTALFAFGAAVQVNDPDPLRWMLIYGTAAATSLFAALDRARWPVPAAVGLVALVWAATLAPGVLVAVGLGEMVSAWEMKDARIEEGREMYGLLLIFAWMSVLTAIASSRRRSQ